MVVFCIFSLCQDRVCRVLLKKEKDQASHIQILTMKTILQHDQWLRHVHAVIQCILEVESDSDVIQVMGVAGKKWSEECKRQGKGHNSGCPFLTHCFAAMVLAFYTMVIAS